MSISSRQSLDIMYKMNEVDVLKTKILASIANLYDNMTPGNSDPDELADALGDVVLYTFTFFTINFRLQYANLR
jgi:hypothetical protein